MKDFFKSSITEFCDRDYPVVELATFPAQLWNESKTLELTGLGHTRMRQRWIKLMLWSQNKHSNVAAKEELYSDINMCPILIIFLTAKRLSRFTDYIKTPIRRPYLWKYARFVDIFLMGDN